MTPSKMGKTKNLIFLFSFLVRIVFIFAFHRQDLFVKNIITSFHWLHLNNYTPYENECFNPRNQIHLVAFVMRLNSVCGADVSCDTWCSRALNTQLPDVIAERAIHHVIVMDGQGFGQSQ